MTKATEQKAYEIVQDMIAIAQQRYSGELEDNVINTFAALPIEHQRFLLRTAVQDHTESPEKTKIHECVHGYHDCDCVDSCDVGGVIPPAGIPIMRFPPSTILTDERPPAMPTAPVLPSSSSLRLQEELSGVNEKEMIHLKSWLIKAMAIVTVVVLLGLAGLLVYVIGPANASKQAGTAIELGETILDAVP